ncbi:polysaccharide biosynthesis/export family protein [Sphingomonas profundi]|uniref:polysaccharide biosynthesis/export family protein n=1 Tax=Alterirhizorhabdus profundi TaxID=2681549 RepID=UPI001E4209CD|nr:polysaccharide biosynthesis/export family protein [Sphingomonas profundi]
MMLSRSRRAARCVARSADPAASIKVILPMFPTRPARLRLTLATSLVAIALGGCSTLPSSGPTAGRVLARKENTIGFRIVDVDANVLGELRGYDNAVQSAAPRMADLAAQGDNDTVGPGDVLQIGIYEVGATLFSGGGASRGGADGFDPSARGERFEAITVDRDGTIKLPYIGRLPVAGRTPSEIQTMIEQSLRGKSQAPQAVVSVRDNIANTVYVSGDVNKPGRLELTLGRERLLDAIASAGGPAARAGNTGTTAGTSDDSIVRFTRGGRVVEQRLSDIRSGTTDDIPLLAGDRIEVIRRPRTFTVFGATTKVSQVSFDQPSLSLAEAVARIGGPNDNQADASAVFLFRYYPDSKVAAGEVPVIYRLNMMKPASYFLAQRFPMRDKDVIYIANAAANQPGKLVGIINQLFSPFLTARALSRN